MGAEKGELADMLHPQSPTHYHAGRRAAVSVTQIQTEGSDSLSHKRGPNGENQPLCRTDQNDSKGTASGAKAKKFEASKSRFNQQASGSLTSGFPAGLKGGEENGVRKELPTL